jgi:hypothetical protein
VSYEVLSLVSTKTPNRVLQNFWGAASALYFAISVVKELLNAFDRRRFQGGQNQTQIGIREPQVVFIRLCPHSASTFSLSILVEKRLG